MANDTRAEVLAAWADTFTRPPSSDEAEALGRASGEDGFSLRNRLRYYYSLVTLDPPAVDRLLPHLLVIIDQAPFVGAVNSLGLVEVGTRAHDQIRKHWLTALDRIGDDPGALVNAADFFVECDLDRAEEILRRVLEIAPADPPALLRAASFYLRAFDIDRDPLGADKARGFAKRALSEVGAPHYGFGIAAMASLEAGEHEEAARLAQGALNGAVFSTFETRHRGRTVVGCLLTHAGDLDGAEVELEASADGAFGWGGPSLRLARRLGAAGRAAAPIAYLEAVRACWQGPVDRLTAWTAAAHAGNWSLLVNPGQ